MQSPLQIGITGGIGSGKSTVAAIFASLGIPVFDADTQAKAVMAKDSVLRGQIIQEFGSHAYDSQGSLNRKFLADQVFAVPTRLEKLNNLVHPRVAASYQQWLKTQEGKPYILKEAALLFESGTAAALAKIIVVTAPEELRINRVKKRDNRSEEEIKNIINRQWPQNRVVEKADYMVINDRSNAILPQVLMLHQVFLDLKNDSKK